MTERAIDQETELLLQSMADQLTGPRAGECVACYVARMLDEFGCDDTLRFALRFRDLCAPRATALPRRLGQMGGYCDCEIFLNGLALSDEPLRNDEDGNLTGPDSPPTCRRVRKGSTQPCTNWMRRRRGRWW